MLYQAGYYNYHCSHLSLWTDLCINLKMTDFISQVCNTVNEQECSTVDEQVCETVFDTRTEQQCQTVYEQECQTTTQQVRSLLALKSKIFYASLPSFFADARSC